MQPLHLLKTDNVRHNSGNVRCNQFHTVEQALFEKVVGGVATHVCAHKGELLTLAFCEIDGDVSGQVFWKIKEQNDESKTDERCKREKKNF
jgi:hypothetical protein